MSQTSRTTAIALVVMAAVLLIGPGCSHEGSMDPAGPTSNQAVREAFDEVNTFVEPYDTRRNEGGWSFHTNHPYVIEREGGNPGGYLHDPLVVSALPHPGTRLGTESMFTGNYRARNVTSVGIDLRSIYYDGDPTSRRLCVLLMNDNGTAGYLEDDWGAFFEGEATIPSKYVPMKAVAGAVTLNEPGWKSFDFDIPSQEDPKQWRQFPEGWTFFQWYDDGDGQRPGESWGALMENVSYIEFPYGRPDLWYIFHTWELGLDNPRISWE